MVGYRKSNPEQYSKIFFLNMDTVAYRMTEEWGDPKSLWLSGQRSTGLWFRLTQSHTDNIWCIMKQRI